MPPTRRFVPFVVFVGVVSFVVSLGPAAPAAAQDLFPRFDFRVDGQYLTSADRRFDWSFNFGGDVDVVDYGRGRATFRANYEAMAGREFRRFDVNQGNYLLEGSTSLRLPRMEVALVWHHVSRHVSDRPKRFPIDWNQIAGRIAAQTAAGRAAVWWQTDLRATVTKAFVDYAWELETSAGLLRPLSQRYAAIGSGNVRLVGTDGSRNRGTQVAGRLEAGVRLNGRSAAAELFAGVERRLDPHQLEFSTSSWLLAGFRLTSMP
jgi:hypothetical protein